MSAPLQDHLIGQLLDDRYRLDELIGYGGMSRIYRAVDGRLHRPVAVKILNDNYARDPQVRERFASEAVIAANINHPNVVSTRDHNASGSLVYLVMEFVRGQNLHELISRRGRLTPRQTLSVLESICRGLAAAHREGIVHRDMKPGNVLMADNGEVKITDFGLARVATAHTQSSTLLATLQYASPELVSGQPADSRSDIYAVGVMIFQMLTGQLPYPDATVPALMRHHLESETPLPSTRVPGLAQDLDELVRFCTEKDPENRPQDAGFLLDEVIQIGTTLSDEQLDLGADAYGGIGDLIPDAVQHPTTVQQRLDHWQREREAQRDPWWVRPNAAAAGAGQEGHDEPQAAQDPTTVLDAAGQPTQALGADAPATEAHGSEPQAAGDPEQRTGTEDAAADAGGDPREAHTTAYRQAGEPATVAHERSGQHHAPATMAMPREERSGATAVSEDSADEPPSKRELKRAQRQWRKQAQVPTHRLGKPRSPAQKVLVSVLLLAVVALVAAGAWFFGRGPGSVVNIPSLSGLVQAQAVQRLESAGVPVRVNNAYDDEVAPGRVIDSNPAEGENIMRFQGVELVISRGPELFQMPDVTGMDTSAARQRLQQMQLSAPSVGQEYSQSVDEGQVISSKPAAGEQLTRKTATSLVVSAGPAPVNVPSLVGLDEQAARGAVEELGLSLQVGEPVYSSDVPRGQVAVQDPAEGTVPAGGSISVQLSQGPEYVQIPSVIGQEVEQAVSALEQAGFQVETRDMLGGHSSTVRLQTPLNQQAERGATITLYVF